MDRDKNLAYKGFEKMPEKNVVSWTLMITRFMYTIMLPIRGHKFWSWRMVLRGFTLSGVL